MATQAIAWNPIFLATLERLVVPTRVEQPIFEVYVQLGVLITQLVSSYGASFRGGTRANQ